MQEGWWDTVLEFINKLGWTKGTFTLFFWMAHFAFFRMVKGRLNDKQKEIDRIAEENREYRERFTQLLDKRFDLNINNGGDE